MSDEAKKCQAIDHPNILPGSWGCCCCNTLNGSNRDKCKYCGHECCLQTETKVVPIQQEGGILLATVKIPEDDKGKLN